MIADDLEAWLTDPDEQNSNAAVAPDVPESFVEFCAWLGVELYPAQRVLCRVAYDGVDPCDLTGEEREIARQLFGEVERVPESARGVIVAVCGARAGKTYVLGALKLLHAALTVDIRALAPGERAVAMVVAPLLVHARHALGYIRGAIGQRQEIEAAVLRQNVDSIVIRRADGEVSLECRAASGKGVAGRGFSLVWALLDECAFFRGDDQVVNDREIYAALAPRLLPGGKMVLVSTPWGEMGLLYERFVENYAKPGTALAAHAPTIVLNPTKAAEVERERQNDPDNARREFDAEFLAAGSETIFDPRAVRASIKDLKLPEKPELDSVTAVGADFGFRTDSSAMVAVQLGQNNRYRVLAVEEIRPLDGPLKPSRVVSQFASLMSYLDVDTLVADGHYRESVTEHLEEHELYFQPAPEGAEGKAAAYAKARQILHEGRVDLPDEPRLLRQLKEVTKRPTSGGGIRIDSPRWRTGGHGDLVTALVWALYAASVHELPEVPSRHEEGTPDYHRHQAQRRKERWIEEYRRRQDQAPHEQDNSWILGP